MKKFAKKLSFNLQQGTKFTPPKELLCEIKAMKLKYGGATKELFRYANTVFDIANIE